MGLEVCARRLTSSVRLHALLACVTELASPVAVRATAHLMVLLAEIRVYLVLACTVQCSAVWCGESVDLSFCLVDFV